MPRAPRPPSRWAPIAAFSVILVGVVVALYFAFHTVNGSGTGCGQPALSIVVNGDGSDIVVGNAHRGFHSASSDCYKAAKIDVVVAVIALVAPFVGIAIAIAVSRSDRSDERLDDDRGRRSRR
jgi:hypothetical protein